MRIRTLMAATVAGLLTLSACSASQPTSETKSDRSFDVSQIKKVDAIAALLPQGIKDKGKLTIGASLDYAPAEFRAEDLKTAIGYDVDLGKAIGKVLGVETEVVHGEFASLLAGIGSKYDIGISAFSISAERIANYNMISYIKVGSSFAVKKGNPEGFKPAELCGQSVAVLTGSTQDEELTNVKNKACTDAGKPAIEILRYPAHSDATTNVVGGKAKAFYADSTVSEYAATLTGGQLEVVGGVLAAGPQGIVVAKSDAALTSAIQKAVQQLMDDGTWNKILASWGIKDAGLKTAAINPKQ